MHAVRDGSDDCDGLARAGFRHCHQRSVDRPVAATADHLRCHGDRMHMLCHQTELLLDRLKLPD